MSKAWSAFWLVIASVVAINIIGAMIEPWLPLLTVSFVLILLAVVGFSIYRFIRQRRRFF